MASDHWTFRPDARLQYQAYESATCATSSPKVRTVATGRYVYLSAGTKSTDLLTAVWTSSKPPRNPSRTLDPPDWAGELVANRTRPQNAASRFVFIRCLTQIVGRCHATFELRGRNARHDTGAVASTTRTAVGLRPPAR